MAARRSKLISKAYLQDAFEAAKEAGYDEASVTVETPDGRRLRYTASTLQEARNVEATAYDAWKAGHAS